MEYFWCEGGHRPYFLYRVKVPKCTTEMYMWCKEYKDRNEYFHRFHVEWQTVHQDRNYDVIQFEREEPYLTFLLKFGV